MIASTGPFNASIDMAAAADRGIHVGTTGGSVASTVELTWALILGAARHLVDERRSVAEGGWQTTVGRELDRRVLGVLGLGRIGARVARIGTAFGMDVVAWSQNLTPDAAAEAGARWVPRDEFFAAADVVDGAPQAQRALPRPDRAGRTRGDEADRAAGQHLARADRRRGRADRGAAVGARSRAPHSTSSTPNRCPPTIRCARFPTCSPRRTSATSPIDRMGSSSAMASRPSPNGSTGISSRSAAS